MSGAWCRPVTTRWSDRFRGVYIDETLLRTTKVAAARSGKREYEVFEEALRKHLGLAEAVERIWAGISREEAPSEEEATRVAAEELAAVRSNRRAD